MRSMLRKVSLLAHPVLPKAVYFSFFFAFGLSGPFFPLIMSGLISEPLVGWLLGMMQIASIFFPPLWGFLSDLTQRPRLLLSSLVVLSFALRAFGTFWLTPELTPVFCMAVFVIADIFFCGIVPILDSFVNRILADSGESSSFGAQRIWGAIGWGLAGPFSGLVFGSHSSIKLGWTLFASFFAGFILVAVLYFVGRPPPGPSKPRISFREAFRTTKLSWTQIGFFLIVIPAGFASASISTWISVYLKVLSPEPESYLRMIGLMVRRRKL